MSYLFLFLCLFPAGFLAQMCDDSVSVDLTTGADLGNGTMSKDGRIYTAENIYRKVVGGVSKAFGCLCKNVRKCIRKCCPLGQVIVGKICTVYEDSLHERGLQLYYVNRPKKIVNVSKEFTLMFGRPCRHMYIEDDGKLFVQKDGKLYIELKNVIPPWTVRGPDQYCLDTFVFEDEFGVKTTKLDALVCFDEDQIEQNYLLSSTCMLISCFFILLTVAVYACLPELRNTLHGRVLMTYLLCIFVGFAFLTTMQIMLYIKKIENDVCVSFTFIIYYFLLASFFWLNVMSFDIWWTFSGKRGLSLEKLSVRGRFNAYALYSFGIPAALTILLISLEFSNLPPHPLLPMLQHQGCFIFGTSKLLYLYGPIIILWVANMVFFILTAVRIALINKQTSVLKSKESATHDQHRKDKQSLRNRRLCVKRVMNVVEAREVCHDRSEWKSIISVYPSGKKTLTLYLKLFLVMGISWILEVVSAVYPDAQVYWQYTDAYNVLIGLTIFIIFVCKKKIFRLIKKRILGQNEDDDSPQQNNEIPIQGDARRPNVQDSDHVDQNCNQ